MARDHLGPPRGEKWTPFGVDSLQLIPMFGKIDYRNKGTLLLTSLLEDLDSEGKRTASTFRGSFRMALDCVFPSQTKSQAKAGLALGVSLFFFVGCCVSIVFVYCFVACCISMIFAHCDRLRETRLKAMFCWFQKGSGGIGSSF